MNLRGLEIVVSIISLDVVTAISDKVQQLETTSNLSKKIRAYLGKGSSTHRLCGVKGLGVKGEEKLNEVFMGAESRGLWTVQDDCR